MTSNINIFTATKISFEEIFSLVNRSETSKDLTEKAINNALINAPTEEAYFEVLAKRVASKKLSIGDVIQPSLQAKTETYTVTQIIEDKCGLRAVFLAPLNNKNASPLVLFRSTDDHNIHNLIDDLNKDGGGLNFQRCKEKLKKELEKTALEYGAVHLLGYSFGGAIARRTVAEFPEYIKRCTVHNALRPGNKAREIFKAKMRQLPQGIQQPEVWEYRHAKDMVSLFGGRPFPTTKNRFYTIGTVQDKISHVAAHSYLGLSDTNSSITSDAAIPKDYSQVASVGERLRRKISSVLTPVHKLVMKAKTL